MKKGFFYALFVVILFSSCSKQTALFNGKDLKGWYTYNETDKKQPFPKQFFAVSDSMIRLYGEKPGYLMTEKSYNNFDLTLEFRWNTEQKFFRNNNVKNSGVMYNIPDYAPDILWPRGIQFQIKQGFTGDFVLLDSVTLKVRGETKPAGKSVAVARDKDNENAVGTWNKLKIISKDGNCWQYLNGILVNEGTNSSTKKGRILLQYEGSPIDFRRIVLKRH